MIAKRRQDTLDMCRIFTEESAKIQQTKPKIINSYQYIQRKPNTRYKREANIQPLESDFSGIPGRIREYDNLKLQDARRYKREINSVANADLINNNINAKNINIGVVGVETKKDNKNNLTVNSHLKTEDIRRTESAATPNPVNPALSHQDIVKIENIVEKIYNDMGPVDKVSFRRNPLVTATTTTQVNLVMFSNSITLGRYSLMAKISSNLIFPEWKSNLNKGFINVLQRKRRLTITSRLKRWRKCLMILW